MSAEIDAHITKKYEIKKRLGKGVCPLLMSLLFGAIRAIILHWLSFYRRFSILLSLSMFIGIWNRLESYRSTNRRGCRCEKDFRCL